MFPAILLADSTFNIINTHGLRVLHYASVSNINLWFSVGVGFMKGNEVSTHDFEWQLAAFKHLVHDNNDKYSPKGNLRISNLLINFLYLIINIL